MKPLLFAIMILVGLPMAARADSALPVENGLVTSGVGWRIDPFGSGKLAFHRGIDIAVPAGTPVHAIRKGRVVFAGAHGGHGSTVIVEHANGDRTLYGHNSIIRVQPGDMVESGTVIAFSGNSGRSTGPHVHFEQLPGNRSFIEVKEQEEVDAPKAVNSRDQRFLLEQKMDESVDSVLRRINGLGAAGKGG